MVPIILIFMPKPQFRGYLLCAATILLVVFYIFCVPHLLSLSSSCQQGNHTSIPKSEQARPRHCEKLDNSTDAWKFRVRFWYHSSSSHQHSSSKTPSSHYWKKRYHTSQVALLLHSRFHVEWYYNFIVQEVLDLMNSILWVLWEGMIRKVFELHSLDDYSLNDDAM